MIRRSGLGFLGSDSPRRRLEPLRLLLYFHFCTDTSRQWFHIKTGGERTYAAEDRSAVGNIVAGRTVKNSLNPNHESTSTRGESTSSPREQTPVEPRKLKHVRSMMSINRNPPSIEQRELRIIRQNLRRRRARILNLYTTIRAENGGI